MTSAWLVAQNIPMDARGPSLQTLSVATWRELRQRPLRRALLVAAAVVVDWLVLFTTSLVEERWPRFSPEHRGIIGDVVAEASYPTLPVVFCAAVFVLSFVSTMHRGLTEGDFRRAAGWGPLSRLAIMLALADVVLWPAGLAVAAIVGAGIGSSGNHLLLMGWGMTWIVTRVALGAPEACALDRQCGWLEAIRLTRPRGRERWKIALPHLLILVVGVVVVVGYAASPIHSLIPLVVVQLAVSFDAAASAAWYRSTCREPASDDLVRVFE